MDKSVNLLFSNKEQQLPRRLFLLRMLLVLFGLVGSVIYSTPNRLIPKLIARGYRKIKRATSGNFDINDKEEYQIIMLWLLMTIILLVVVS